MRASSTLHHRDVAAYDFEPYSDAFIKDQHAHFHRMRDLGPVVWLPQIGSFAITRYAELREALRNWQVFSSAQGVAGDDFGCKFTAGVTLSTDPPRHDEMRKVLAAPLLPKALESVRERVEIAATLLVEALVKRKSFDGISDFARHLPVTLVTDLVGLPEGGRENMLKWASAAFNVLGVQNARGRESLKTIEEMREWILNNATPDRFAPESWTARLYERAEKGEIPKSYCPLIMRDYLSPALDTTISATGQLIYQLGKNPEQWEMLRRDPSLIPNAANEAVRLGSPIRSFTRTLTCDFAIGGVDLPKGARVMMLYASGNRDERRFANPDQFDITRDDLEHLGFGSGVHMCAGMNLALLEMKSLLKAMIPRIERISVGKPTLAYNNTINAFASVPVTVQAAKQDQSAAWIDVTVHVHNQEAEDIVSVEITSCDGSDLPRVEAGAHIDVRLENGIVRQYSICSADTQPSRYRLGILREPNSRGGSVAIHDTVKVGSILKISRPKNFFPLIDNSVRSLLFAGGIGVTPIMSMASALASRGADFEMHYAVRSKARAAFVEELQSKHGNRVHLYADDAIGAPRFEIAKALEGSDPSCHLYCCGPEGFINHVVSSASERGWDESHIHVERFAGQTVQGGEPFSVVAQRSNKTIEVGPDETMLEALGREGIDLPSSCQTGVCGTCIVDVLEGTPDHRDLFQSRDEKFTNKRVAVCCSRAKSKTLVLDI